MTVPLELELSAEEKEAIKEFRENLPSYVDKEIRDDTYLLYLYLKDQNMDVNEAEKMLTKTLKWRQKIQIDTIADYKPPEVLRNYFTKNRIGVDKEGAIVHYLPLGKADVKGLYMSAKFADLEKTLVQVVEEDFQLCKKKRKSPSGPYPGVIHIYDVDGLTFANATDKKGIEYLIHSLKIIQDYYAGLLKAVYIINISSFFMIPLAIVKGCLSPSTMGRAQFFGADGWKEELLRVIDADELPAFLGGKKTDPDGNIMCKTLVMEGGKIDEKNYIHKSKNPLTNAPGVKKVVVPRASFSEIELKVEEDGSLIEWEFETKTRDIGFGLFYKEMVDGEEKITELVPLIRINTEDYSETGMYKCEKAGTHVILFDNSYSWVRAKEIFYRAKVVSPKDQEI